MNIRLKRAILVLFAVIGFPAASHAFSAPPKLAVAQPLAEKVQLRLDFGISDAVILRSLRNQGYHDIRITDRKLTKARAQACKNGNRFDVEVASNGRIRRAVQVGRCRSEVGPQQVQQILKKRGIRANRIAETGDGFAVIGCRGDRRLRVEMNRFGEIVSERPLGRCGGRLSERELVMELRSMGFSRIRLDRRQKGRWHAVACRGDIRVELRIDNGGDIVRERRTGRCDPPIHPGSIPRLLAKQGYSRIDVFDRELPRYQAHACRELEKVAISLNRFGEIIDEHKIGQCEPPLTPGALVAQLRSMGYRHVRVVEQSPGGFKADVCDKKEKIRLSLTLFGEITDEERLGRCRPPRVSDILADFESRGMRNPTLFVEGCRHGTRVLVELDKYGEPLESRLAGRCR